MMADDFDDPFDSQDITPAISAEWEARRRVAAAIKSLTEALVTSAPAPALLDELTTRLDAMTATLAAGRRLYGRLAFAAEGSHGNFAQLGHELNALSGLSNPVAPPVHTWIDGDMAHGRVTVGWSGEGPPGTVHGGMVAAIFDQFLGTAQVLGRQPGMTGVLTTHFHRPTPLNTELRLQGRLLQAEGRKTRMVGEMYAGEVRTASCEGLFIRPRAGIAFLDTP